LSQFLLLVRLAHSRPPTCPALTQLTESSEDLNDAIPGLKGFPLGSVLALVGFTITLVFGKLLVTEKAVIAHLHAHNRKHSTTNTSFGAAGVQDSSRPGRDGVVASIHGDADITKSATRTSASPHKAEKLNATIPPAATVQPMNSCDPHEFSPLLGDWAHSMDPHKQSRLSYHVVESKDHCGTCMTVSWGACLLPAWLPRRSALPARLPPSLCTLPF